MRARNSASGAAVAILAALACGLTGAGLQAAPAQAEETVLQDDAHLLYRSDDEVRQSLTEIRALGVDRVRLTAGWSVIAPDADSPQRPDFDASDPAAYPAANWANLDRAVRLAHEAGLQVMIDIAFWAPRWATHEDPATPNRLRTEIDPHEYALFAQAVARRYDGSFVPPRDSQPGPGQPAPPPSPDATLLGQLLGGLGGSKSPPPTPPAPLPPKPSPPQPLPAVSMYTIWNEPNLQVFLLPQWQRGPGGWYPRSAEIYRAMVQATYPAIKAVSPGAQVLIGGTAGTASRVPGVGSVPPLRFLRALACVNSRLRPIRTGGCANFQRIPGDGWAHHPYSTKTLPSRDASDPDNVPVAGLPRLASTLRTLVRRGRLAPAVANLYVTEYGYETSPPDPHAPFGPQRQGPLLAQAEYIATRLPAVRMWGQFMIRDLEGDGFGGDWQSGLYFADGTPKPAAATFRTPSYAACVRRGRTKLALVWGRVRGAPSPSQATVEVSAGSAAWRAQASWSSPRLAARARASATVALAADAALTRYVPWRSGAVYRIRWTGADGSSQVGPPVVPDACPPAPAKAKGKAKGGEAHVPGKRRRTSPAHHHSAR
jgi:hypothetical protein